MMHAIQLSISVSSVLLPAVTVYVFWITSSTITYLLSFDTAPLKISKDACYVCLYRQQHTNCKEKYL